MEDLSLIQKIIYAVCGGITLILIKHTYAIVRDRLTGRDRLLRYSAIIKRHSHNRMEVETCLHENGNVRSIIMRGVDAVYIAMRGKKPSVALLNLRKT